MSTDAEAAMNRWWPLKETEWSWPILDYSNLLEIKSSIKRYGEMFRSKKLKKKKNRIRVKS